MPTYLWVIWALVLIVQNFLFTFVSRARNSGSIRLHMVAAIGSNGVWFASQLIVVSQFMDILTGKYGVRQAILAGLFYTSFTVIGSLLAHWYALKTEKGKTSVGANSKYVQITVEEWASVQEMLAAWNAREQRLTQWRETPLSVTALRADLAAIADTLRPVNGEQVSDVVPVAPPEVKPPSPSLPELVALRVKWRIARVRAFTTATGHVLAKDLFRDYVEWSKDNGNLPHMNYGDWLADMRKNYTVEREPSTQGRPYVFPCLRLK